jgi:hypothetical protein
MKYSPKLYYKGEVIKEVTNIYHTMYMITLILYVTDENKNYNIQ